jgi:hypothetical protein
MFKQYLIYYDNQLVGSVMALSHQSAFEKGCKMVKVSASAFSGTASRLVKAVCSTQ